MICITGIPGTGKTTICKMLNENGIKCHGLNKFAMECGAISDDIVDIDMLMEKRINFEVVESHYSHLLDCQYVIILEDDESQLRNRMHARGYPEEKIEENIDAQLSGLIYFEAADRLPANHIYTIKENSRSIDEVFKEVIGIILFLNGKVN
ncbi:adenylate kinase family protein [Ferroplasma sp.]|uniref:adenylate kinase family protein n=1 Tax=Ferroplasma sp. TaxID=2591003 RepID=UPI00307EE7FE